VSALDGFGRSLLAKVKSAMGREWAELPPDAVESVEAALLDAAALTIRSLNGENVGIELATTKATIANWQFVNASRVQAAMEAAAKEALQYAGEILLGVIAAAV